MIFEHISSKYMDPTRDGVIAVSDGQWILDALER